MAGGKFVKVNVTPRRRPRRHTRVPKKIKKAIQKIVHKDDEMKVFDTDLTSTVYNLGLNTVLTNIPQGVAQSQRQGDEVAIHSLDLRLNVDFPAVVPSSFRCIIYKWKVNEIMSLSGTGIMKAANISTSLATVNEYTEALIPNRTIIYDRTFTAMNGALNGSMTIHKKINLKDYKLRFNPAATTGTNQLAIQFWSDNVLANAITVYWTARVNYTDA